MKKFKSLFNTISLKSLLNAMAISIAVFTVISVGGYLLLGHGGFDLVTPFGVNRKNYTYNALFATLFYAMVGAFCYHTTLLIKKDALGLKLTTVFHFLIGLTVFFIYGFLQKLPWGADYHTMIHWVQYGFVYRSATIYADGTIGAEVTHYEQLLIPLVISIICYIACYIFAWISTRFEIKLINRKIKEPKK
jgi:hypothetical protein